MSQDNKKSVAHVANISAFLTPVIQSSVVFKGVWLPEIWK